MKTAPVLFLLLTLAGLSTMGQTLVQGLVKDNNGQPVVGANVVLNGAYDGASTDAAGTFKFSTKQSGSQTLVVSFLGFATLEQPVTLNQAMVTVALTLKPDYRQLQAVQISAGAFEASDEKRAALLTSKAAWALARPSAFFSASVAVCDRHV